MAKGDRETVQNAISNYGGQASGNLGANINQASKQYSGLLMPAYAQGMNRSLGSYDEIMQGYRNFLGGGAMGPGGQYSYGQNMPTTPMQGGYQFQNNPILKGGPAGMQPMAGGMSIGPSLPSATGGDISGGGAPAMQTNTGGGFSGLQGDPNDPNYQRQFVNDRIQATQGRQATDQDYNYWLPKFQQAGGLGTGEYWYNRMTDPQGTGSNAAPTGGGGGFPGAINSALGGYGNFAQTGGFTPQQIQDLRARAIAPTRGIYQNMQDDLSRQRELTGGYMPNYGATAAKLARDASGQIGDINTAANAQIAQMVQQGQLAGLGGLSQTGLLGQGQNLAGLQGMAGMYGAAPGMASTFGNQMLGGMGQNLQGQQLSNQLNLGLIGSTLQGTQVPSDWQQFLGTWGPMISGGLGGFL